MQAMGVPPLRAFKSRGVVRVLSGAVVFMANLFCAVLIFFMIGAGFRPFVRWRIGL